VEVDQQLYRYFDKFFPGKVAGAVVTVNEPDTAALLTDLEATDIALERAIVLFHNSGDQERPMMRLTAW
jgi:hypothetical protein